MQKQANDDDPYAGKNVLRTGLSLGAAAIATGLLFLAAVAVSGGGHGWNSGAVGGLWLCPITFLAVFNALRKRMSRKVAVVLIWAGLAVCALTVTGTLRDDRYYFSVIVENLDPASFIFFVLVGFSWLFASLAALHVRQDASGLNASAMKSQSSTD
jgi:hypothetical protein